MVGNGVVIDPHALVAEIGRLRDQGVTISPDNLRIADNATLILSVHRNLDGYREDAAKSGTKIGTTRRGIGPAYEDKVGRRAIRVMDLADQAGLPAKIDRLLAHHNALLRGFGIDEVDATTILDELTSVAAEILPYRATGYETTLNSDRIVRECLVGIAMRKKGIEDTHYLSPMTVDDGRD